MPFVSINSPQATALQTLSAQPAQQTLAQIYIALKALLWVQASKINHDPTVELTQHGTNWPQTS